MDLMELLLEKMPNNCYLEDGPFTETKDGKYYLYFEYGDSEEEYLEITKEQLILLENSTYIEVGQRGEGLGEDAFEVLKIGNRYIGHTGYYSSWDGTDRDNGDGIKEYFARPIEDDFREKPPTQEDVDKYFTSLKEQSQQWGKEHGFEVKL